MALRWIVLVGLAAGCHRTPEAPPPPLVGDETGGWTDERANDTWRALAPTGATWAATLDMPAEQRRPLALALLRGGNLACDAVDEQDQCGQTVRLWRALDPAADLDDPCLRRLLVPWAFGQLTADDVRSLEPVLTELVAMTAPEEDLQAVAYAAAPDDPMRLRLLAAMLADVEGEPDDERTARAETFALALTSDEARLAAIDDLHLESVIDALDPATYRARQLAALSDDKLASETRSAELDRYAADPGADVTAALLATAEATDCQLAMRAIDALADRGDTSLVPARPTSLDPDDHVRALCLLEADGADDADPRYQAWFGKTVELVDDQQDYDPDSASGVSWQHDVTRAAAADVTIPAELGAGDWSCSGLTCDHTGFPNDVAIDFAKAGRSLRIVRIAIKLYAGDVC
jgi:hypothetical protein